AHTVEIVGKGQTITAEKILIATGGRPWKPEGLTGVEHAITSEEAFHLPELPTRILIAGGGYIAVEFAGIFAGLGVETTLIYR
ncbi:FAD-dependent oxidoreductase, partial [Klebsiella pneumoniae]|uniref:FAD-dependent oxidoreductase n=1 Tax=Klebsiella pneumoniae TaxID=573 RepID=UPI0027318804